MMPVDEEVLLGGKVSIDIIFLLKIYVCSVLYAISICKLGEDTMNKSELKGLLFTTALAFGMAATNPAGRVHAEEIEKPVVDKSKGVTSIYNNSDEVIGYNLNGNSVIIESVTLSDKDAVTGDEIKKSYINITIDSNSNGIVDEGEDKVTELNSSIPIYGSMDSVVNDAVRITYTGESINGQTIYGAFGSELNSEITFDIHNASAPVSFYALHHSTAGEAGDVNISISDSDITSVYGLYSSSTKGNVVEDVKASNLGYLYGLSSGSTATGTMTVQTDDMCYLNNLYGLDNSSIGGDLTVDLRGYTGDDDKYNTIYGVYGQNAEYVVGGDYNFNLEGGKFYSVYALNGNSSVVGAGVKGNISINVTNTNISSGFYGLYQGKSDGNIKFNMTGSSVKYMYGLYKFTSPGDYNFKSDEDCSFEGYTYVAYNTSIGGNADVTVKNKYTGHDYNSLYALYCTNVGKNVNVDISGGKIQGIYGIYNYGTNPGYSIGGDIDVNIHDVASGYTNENSDGTKYYSYSSVYGLSNVNNGGNIKVNLSNIDCIDNSVYGVYSLISGCKELTVNMNKIKCGYIYGAYQVSAFAQNTDIDITECEASTIYGVNQVGLGSDVVDVNVDNCYAKNNIYVAYNGYDFSINSNNYKSGFGAADVTLNVSNSSTGYNYKSGENDYYSSGTIYLAQGYYDGSNFCNGDLTLTSENNETYGFYGAYGGHVGGDITFTSDKDKTVIYKSKYSDGTYSTNYGYYYGISNDINCDGKVSVSLKDSDVSGLNLLSCYASGGASATLSGGSIAGSYCSLYSCYKELKDTDVKVDLYGVDFRGYVYNEESTATISINNSANGTGRVTVTMDDACTLPSDYSIYANTYNNSEIEAIIKTKDTIYISGNVEITDSLIKDYQNVSFSYFNKEIENSITKDNIDFYYSNVLIPDGTIVKATKRIDAKEADFVLEGTLTGEFDEYTAEELEKNGGYTKAESNRFYMNGGSCSNIPEKANVLYPVIITNNNELAGKVSVQKGTESNVLRKDALFAKVNDSVIVRAAPEEGYEIKSAVLKLGGEEDASAIKATKQLNYTDYSFDMVTKPANLDIEFIGGKITIGKTVLDPVAVIGRTYTLDNPLYDFDSLRISYDSSVGDLSVKVSEFTEHSLPKGLKVEDGKIIGTYNGAEIPEGIEVTFDVTARNGAGDEIILNIKAAKEEGGAEGSPIGRVTIDEEKKIINLYGNSVVIDEVDDLGTCIYMDDDMDGKADSSTPALYGDFAAYTLVGVEGSQTEKQLFITMKGGVFTAVTGFSKSSQALENPMLNGLVISVQGGKAGNIYALTNSNTNAEIYMEVSDASYGKLYAYSGSSTYTNCKGILMVSAGAATSAGTYHMKSDAEFTSLRTGRAISGYYYNNDYLIVPKNTEVKVSGSLYIDSYSGIYVQGKLSPSETRTLYGQLIVAKDGVLNTENNWNGVYYPFSFETNLKNTVVNPNSCLELSSGKEKEVYVVSGNDVYFTFTQPVGYTLSYSINKGDAVETANTREILKTPYGPMTVKLAYSPKQIDVNKVFAEARGTVNKQYTKEIPLFDYTLMAISNDTDSMYSDREKVEYEVTGGKLPQGLELSDGKVCGTPVKVESGRVVVTVTGMNGTTAEIPIEFTIETTASYADINDGRITFDGYLMNLKGTSVVILPDSTNSSCVNIYMDSNHDGVADNSNPYMYKGSMSINLSGCSLYGYNDTSKSLDDDLSIYMYGGEVGYLYGAMSNSVINGNVTVDISGGYVSYGAAALSGASAKKAAFIATGGSFNGTVAATMNAKSVEEVNFRFSDKAVYSNGYSSSSRYVAATTGGEVSGDVNVIVGSDASLSTGFTGTYSRYYGIYGTKVKGDVNYNVTGNMVLSNVMWFVSNGSEVEGNVNVDWQNGRISGPSNYMNSVILRDSTVKGDLKVEVEGAPKSYSTLYTLASSKVNNLYWNGPDSGTYIGTSIIYNNDNSTISGKGYMLNGRYLEYYGDNTLDVDFSGNSIKVYENSTLTIGEDTSVGIASNITNYGTIINNGSIEINGTVYAGDSAGTVGGKYLNRGSMTYPSGKSMQIYIYAKGEFENEGILSLNSYYNYIYGSFKNFESGTVNYGGRVYTDTSTKTIENSGIININSNFTLKGRLENSGKIVNNSYNGIILSSGAALVNKKDGVLELNRAVNNGGYIANYGSIVQTLNSYESTSLGILYNSGDIKLGIDKTNNNYKYYANNSKIYFPVTAEYPEDAFGGLKLNTVNSPEEGDAAAYAKAGAELVATFESPADGFSFEDIKSVYICDDEMSSSGEGSFKGTMPMQSAVVTVEMNVGEGGQIAIDPVSTQISGLQVGKAIESIDLSTITVTNDDDNADGKIKYTESIKYPLPEGLKLSDGRISGTPKRAVTENQISKIIITGKNYSRAEYTITFGAVEKGIPTFNMPKPYGYPGYLLSNVYFDESRNDGIYSWDPAEKPNETVIDEKAIKEETFKLFFTPADLINYDWSKVEGEGIVWNSTSGRLEIDTLIRLYQVLPAYTVPESVSAVYGQTLEDIVLPKDDNGAFEWMTPETSVGTVGSRYFYAKYVPDDQKRYRTRNNIAILVSVSKAERYVTVFNSFEAKNGDRLSDIELPASEDGRYEWISDKTMKIYSDRLYRVVFIADDSENLDWRVSSDDARAGAYISATYGGAVFNVRATGDDLEKDPSGGDIDEPTPTPESHSTETPTIEPSEKPTVEPTAEIVVEPTKEPSAEPTKVPVIEPTEEPSAVPAVAPGTVLKPSGVNGKYKTVDKSALTAEDEDPDEADEIPDDDIEGPFAIYTGPDNKNVSSIVVPDTITVDGVTYKVIGIADGACSGCKKLKKVTIGNNVRYIGKKAFNGDKKLTSVIFKGTSHVKNIKDSALRGCTGLKKISIPASVKYIRNNAFSGCSKLTTVKFAKKSKLRRIGKKAFYNCKSLKTMTITSTKLKKVMSGAFKNAGKKSYKKFTVKVPKSKKKSYKKLMKKAGLNKKVKVK